MLRLGFVSKMNLVVSAVVLVADRRTLAVFAHVPVQRLSAPLVVALMYIPIVLCCRRAVFCAAGADVVQPCGDQDQRYQAAQPHARECRIPVHFKSQFPQG